MGTPATKSKIQPAYAHVAMPIEGLDPSEQFVVVPNVDEHLCVVLDAL